VEGSEKRGHDQDYRLVVGGISHGGAGPPIGEEGLPVQLVRGGKGSGAKFPSLTEG